MSRYLEFKNVYRIVVPRHKQIIKIKKFFSQNIPPLYFLLKKNIKSIDGFLFNEEKLKKIHPPAFIIEVRRIKSLQVRGPSRKTEFLFFKAFQKFFSSLF